MSKPLYILNVVVLIAAALTWFVWVPHVREAGYNQGKAAGSNTMKARLDSLEAVQQRYRQQATIATDAAIQYQRKADSLLQIINTPHDATHYPPVPAGIGAAERKARILAGTAKPL